MSEAKTKEKFKPVMFVSESKGLQVMDEKGDVICKFTSFITMHPKKGEIAKGYYLCKSEKIFKKLTAVDEDTNRTLYGLGRSYSMTKKLPMRTDIRGNIMRGVATGSGIDRPVSDLNDEERVLYRELGGLEAKYYRNDGGFKDSVKEAVKTTVLDRISEIKGILRIK